AAHLAERGQELRRGLFVHGAGRASRRHASCAIRPTMGDGGCRALCAAAADPLGGLSALIVIWASDKRGIVRAHQGGSTGSQHAHRCRRAMAASEWDLSEFDPAAVTVEPQNNRAGGSPSGGPCGSLLSSNLQ